MSLLSITNSTAGSLPALNLRPHARRHPGVDSGGTTASTTVGQVPVAAAQNLFGSLLQSLEQVVGLQTGASTAATLPATGTAAVNSAVATPPATSAAAVSSIGSPTGSAAVASVHPANHSLQDYLNTLSRYIKKEGAPLRGLPGTVIDTKA